MTVIRHTGIVTRNIKKSLWFWTKLLDFKIKKQLIESGKTIDSVLGYKNVKVKTLKLKDKQKNLIELLYFYNSPRKKKNELYPYSPGITHISVTVKNLEKKFIYFTKKKIKFNCKPRLSADKKVLMTYCKTPEGCFLEMVQEL